MYDAPQTERDVNQNEVKINARGVQVYYGDTHASKDVDFDIQITNVWVCSKWLYNKFMCKMVLTSIEHV